jgi:hypothetical protein
MNTIRWRTVTLARAALATMYLTAIVSTGALAQTSGPDVSEAIDDAIIYARTMPEAFGGVWLTDDDSGAVFAFTHRATDVQIEDVLARVPEGVAITVVRVDWSEAELDATTEAITDALVARELPFVTGVGPDLPNNAVLVGIVPEYFEACQAGIVARFGPVRIVFESSEPDRGTAASAAAPGSSLPPGCLPSPSMSPTPTGPTPVTSPAATNSSDPSTAP